MTSLSIWAGKVTRRLRRRLFPNTLDLAGDREIEWSFVAGHIPDDHTDVLDFGCGNAPLALAAALQGHRVTAMDLGPVQWHVDSPAIRFIQADLNTYDFGEQRFDVILNCSTIEHVGLAGRYGSRADTDGDLKGMTGLRKLLRPGGRMVLTLPVGVDQVCQPLHRIYGEQRLPRLLAGYQQDHAEFWVKRAGRNVWVPAPASEALAIRGGPAFYGLGLFVLRPA